MDFIFDYDDEQMSSSQSNNGSSVNLLPIPAPPLNLSNLNNYREDLTQKFSNLNILKNLQQKQQQQQQLIDQSDNAEVPDVIDPIIDNEADQLASKYAQLSLDLIKEDENDMHINNYITSNGERGDSTSKPVLVLSSRLARVLNTSNFDSGIRDALVLLQSRILDLEQQQKSKSKQNNEKNSESLLSIDYDTLTDTGLVGSVSRRKLRNEVENDLLKQQFQTLKNYQPIVKKLNMTKEKLENLNNLNDDLLETLDKTTQKTKLFKKNITDLNKEKDLISLKKQLLKNFQKNFTLTRYEEFHLINDDIDEEYLNILTKAETIYKNCSILLSMDNPKIGLNIMNEMNEIVQLSTKRMVNFIKKQFQNFFLMGNNNDLDSNEKHMVFKKCLVYVINKKTENLTEIMDELTSSRSKILVDEFLTQINGYTESLQKQDLKVKGKKKRGDDSRPLMLSIYDSKRFLSDILAYLHDVIVNERELLNNLFDIEDDVISSYQYKESSNSNIRDIVSLVDELIEKNLNVLSKPLRSRIEQIIRSESKLVVLQNIFQLFDLYTLMYSKALRSHKNGILDTVIDLQKLTLERLLSVIKQKLNNIQYKNKNNQDDDHIEEINDDLNIPEWLIEFYGTINPLFDNANSDDNTFMSLSEQDDALFQEMIFERILDILDLQISQNHLKSKQKLVFKLNCYDFISSKFITVKLLSNKWDILNTKINDLKKELTNSQFQLLLKETNLQDIYNLINMIFAMDNDFFDISIYEPINENKLFNFKFFKEINFKLMEVLPLLLIDYQQEELSKILSPSLSNDISIDSSIAFVNFYYKLWLITKEYLKIENSDIVDPENFEKHPVFKWSDVEVATLLGCEQFYLTQKEDFTNSDQEE